MKVLYNWLKDFVDVKASAQELASRLSLAGCNIGAVEDSPSGPVLEADLTTNRPDCLGHYGMAREIAALYHVPLKNVARSEEHTSELQSRLHLVCRLLLEKKKKTTKQTRDCSHNTPPNNLQKRWKMRLSTPRI